jgi:spermidine/putrescine transport system permease protein
VNNRSRIPLLTISLVLFAFLYAPIVVVVVQSLNSATRGVEWRGFTTHWYQVLARNELALHATGITLALAAISTSVSTTLGTLLALGLRRGKFIGRNLTERTLQTVIVVPDIVMAIALLLFYALIRKWFESFSPGLLTMTLAHITFQIPFVTLVIRSRLSGLDSSLNEAAHDLGATGWQTFLHITLPLIWPGILAGSLLAFTLSLDDFVVSFFTTGPGATTLSILIYSSVKRGLTPDINALSTLLVLASIAGTVVVMLLQKQNSKSQISNNPQSPKLKLLLEIRAWSLFGVCFFGI